MGHFFFFFNENEPQIIEQKIKQKEIDMYSYAKLLQTLNDEKYDELRKMLEENIREEAAKKNGNKKPFTIINSMMKQKNVKEDERFLNKAIPMKDGRFAFIDGHRVFISDTDLGYTDRSNLEIDRLLATEIPNFDSEVDIDLVKLKEFIALCKANKDTKKPYIIKVDNYYVAFNPNFAKDLIDWANGNTKLKYQKHIAYNTNNQCNPLFSVNNEGQIVGCILPVHINTSNELVANQ